MSLGVALAVAGASAAGALAWLVAERRRRDDASLGRARSNAGEILDKFGISNDSAAEWLRRQGWEFEFDNSGPEVIADLARGVASCARSGTSTSKQALPADWLERAKAGTDERGRQMLGRSLGASPGISVNRALLVFEKQAIQARSERRRAAMRASYEAGESAADRLAAGMARAKRKAANAEPPAPPGT